MGSPISFMKLSILNKFFDNNLTKLNTLTGNTYRANRYRC